MSDSILHELESILIGDITLIAGQHNTCRGPGLGFYAGLYLNALDEDETTWANSGHGITLEDALAEAIRIFRGGKGHSTDYQHFRAQL